MGKQTDLISNKTRNPKSLNIYCPGQKVSAYCKDIKEEHQ